VHGRSHKQNDQARPNWFHKSSEADIQTEKPKSEGRAMKQPINVCFLLFSAMPNRRTKGPTWLWDDPFRIRASPFEWTPITCCRSKRWDGCFHRKFADSRSGRDALVRRTLVLVVLSRRSRAGTPGWEATGGVDPCVGAKNAAESEAGRLRYHTARSSSVGNVC